MTTDTPETKKDKYPKDISDIMLSDDERNELWKILNFWEKYKNEWKKMWVKFRSNHNRNDFLNLISQYEESKKKFINSLLPEEKEILDKLELITKAKFYREFLNEIILYSGDPEKNYFNSDNNKIEIKGKINEIMAKIENLKWKLQPWMKINLRNNQIWDKWAEAIAEKLKDSLQQWLEINIWDNQIWEKWAKAIAEKWKNSLQPWMTINLWENRIWDDWAKTLAKTWKNSLQPWMRIILRENQIWDAWAQAIIDNLELKDWIVLYLENNNITDETKEKLRAQVIKSNQEKWIHCKVYI